MGASVGADTAFFGQFIQQAEGDELFGEIAYIQFLPQQGLVQGADLGKGEFCGQQVVAYGIVI